MSTATSPSDIVTRITDHLVETVGQQRFSMWFDGSSAMDFDPTLNRLRIAVPNRYVADWISRNFRETLNDATRHATGEIAELEMLVEPDRFARHALSPQTAENNRVEHGTIDPAHARSTDFSNTAASLSPRSKPAAHTTFNANGRHNLRHELTDFIVGPSNAMAFAASQRLADDEVELSGPLFIHGGCGLGKTHLLQGICKRMLERKPDASVLYTTGEQFTNAFITAVRENSLDAFRRKLRSLDLLAVDDVHFIASKEKTQLEFLHSFDQIEMAGARVVLASDCHPKLIKQFSEALISRCIRGLVVPVNKPDLETRVRLIRSLAARRGFVLSEPAARLLASHADPSVRELQGVLTKLHALVTLTGERQPGEPISMALIHKLLDEQFDTQPLRPVRFHDVLEVTCKHVGVETKNVLGPSRHRHLVLARSLAIYLARKLTSMSYPEIADAMHRSNHSTIITACQRMEKQIKDNKPMLLPGRTDQLTPSQLSEEIRREIVHASA